MAESEFRRVRPSNVHDLRAVQAGGPGEDIDILSTDDEVLVTLPVEKDHLFERQFAGLAVGFFNQLLEERTSRDLSAYHEDDPDTDAYVPGWEEKQAEALEAAAENYSMA